MKTKSNDLLTSHCNNLRLIVTFLFLFTIAIILTACSSSGDDNTGEQNTGRPTSSEPVAVFLGDPNNPQGTAIYVDGDNGDNTNGDGSKTNPFASILKAATNSVDVDKPAEIYVTAKVGGTAYVEREFISRRRARIITLPTGVSLFGGYDSDWNRSPGDRTRLESFYTSLSFEKIDMDVALVGFDIASSSSIDVITVYASSTEKGNGTLAIHDSRITSADTASGMSTGLLAANMKGLRVTDTTIIAGNAGDGSSRPDITAAGEDGEDGEDGGDVGSATPTSQQWWRGGDGGAISGQANHHRGGRGGHGGQVDKEYGENGLDGGNGNSSAGKGGERGWIETNFPFDTHAPNIGGNGANGSNGSRGAGGSGHGQIGGPVNLWMPSSGVDGELGQAGYGGGGGGGARAIGGGILEDKEGTGGGGGGSGGAGGNSGGGGSGGEASIGIIVSGIDQVLIENNVIQANLGGHGGNGGAGSVGGDGGLGAPSSSAHIGHLQGASGGAGGEGGLGGGGGGGGGGPSIGIMTNADSKPIVRNNSIMTSTPGNGGSAGNSGQVSAASSGEGGYSVGVYTFDESNPPVMSGNTFMIGTAGGSSDNSRNGTAAQTNF